MHYAFKNTNFTFDQSNESFWVWLTVFMDYLGQNMFLKIE